MRLTQECQESTGRTLTFYKASDRIQVDGNEEVRVQTKGGKCQDAASDLTWNLLIVHEDQI